MWKNNLLNDDDNHIHNQRHDNGTIEQLLNFEIQPGCNRFIINFVSSNNFISVSTNYYYCYCHLNWLMSNNNVKINCNLTTGITNSITLLIISSVDTENIGGINTFATMKYCKLAYDFHITVLEIGSPFILALLIKSCETRQLTEISRNKQIDIGFLEFLYDFTISKIRSSEIATTCQKTEFIIKVGKFNWYSIFIRSTLIQYLCS